MYTAAFFISLITALSQVVKKAFKINNRYIPLVSVILGIGAAFLGQNGFEMTIRETVLFGIFMGLSSCGLFSSLKSISYVTKKISDKLRKNPEKK